ncbi:hypothetical protein ILUMI_16047, partial [Ignelater luminosus]
MARLWRNETFEGKIYCLLRSPRREDKTRVWYSKEAKEAKMALLEWTSVSERINTARFKARFFNLQKVNDELQEKVQQRYKNTYGRYTIDAEIENNSIGRENIMDKEDTSNTNEKEATKTKIQNTVAIENKTGNLSDYCVEQIWCNYKEVQDTEKEVNGITQTTTSETWKLIEERSDIKSKMLNERREDRKTALKNLYQLKNKQIKRCAYKDKRVQLEEFLRIAQNSTSIYYMKTVYDVTRKITRKRGSKQLHLQDKV